MSVIGKERVIERLELLLARVRSRALRAGAEAGGDAGGDEVATLATLPTPAEPWVASAVSAGTLEAEVDRMVASVEGFLPEHPPGNVLENVPGNGRENETEIGHENETETEIEIEVPSDGHDSRERLVTAEPVSVEMVAVEAVAIEFGSIEALEAEPALLEDAAVESAALITPRPPSRPGDESEIHSAAAQESTPPNESADLDQPAPEERPPISSRRVVSSEISQPVERLAHMAFDSEEPPAPRHTPPPESGRLPAAASGTELELEPDDTGVRDATPMLPLRAFQPALRELSPDAVPAELAPSDAVADVIGEAQRFAPATFVALLDASLAL